MGLDAERQRLEFLPGVACKLGWYVYALRDPRDDAVFYIGKGKGKGKPARPERRRCRRLCT